MNREQRRAAARERQRQAPRIEFVGVHCADCGAPFCPVCDDHMTECPDCHGFHCEGCGYFLGFAASGYFSAS